MIMTRLQVGKVNLTQSKGHLLSLLGCPGVTPLVQIWNRQRNGCSKEINAVTNGCL